MTFKEYMKQLTGYEVKTTFWEDFIIAEKFGEKEIRDTYKRAFEEWKTNTEYITELVLVLNYKIWNFDALAKKAGISPEDKARYEQYEAVYDELYHECDEWCRENLKGEDAAYYFRTLD